MQEFSAPTIRRKTPVEVLRPKQRLFVEAFVRLRNGKDAAIAAGYAFPEGTASKLLSDSNVMAAVVWLFDKYIEQKYGQRIMSKEEMLWRLTEMARIDLSEFLTEGTKTLEDGKVVKILLPHIDLEKAKRNGKMLVVKSVRNVEHGVEVTFHDVMASMRQLSRVLGFDAAQKVEHSGPQGGAIPVLSVNFNVAALNEDEISTLQILLAKMKAGQPLPEKGAEDASGEDAIIEAGGEAGNSEE